MMKMKSARKSAVAAGLMLMLGAQAFAADRGSSEDQLACTPDVYRLCSSYVPDEDAIVACLNRNIPTLSAGCKKVMTRPPAPSGNKGEQDED